MQTRPYVSRNIGLALAGLILAPVSLCTAKTFKDIVNGSVIPIVDSAVTLFATIAVVVFVFGMVRFIALAGDDKSKSTGKALMTWGLIALFVMVSVWGLVKIVFTTLFG